MNKIGLAMIVKDESHIIERCLDSVRSLVDYILIFDTGSTDDTKTKISEWMTRYEILGQIIDSPWVNFGHNRTEVIQEMRSIDVDYCLMIDADEILVYDPDFDPHGFKLSLDLQVYDILTKSSGVSYKRPQLISNRKYFRYEGAVHEFLVVNGSESRGDALGFYNSPIQDSNRNRGTVSKFKNDVDLIEKELKKEGLSEYMISRYTFYLAQSYRDLGDSQSAIRNYKIRSSQGFWKEEEFISLYNIAKIKNESNLCSKEEVLQDFYKSFEHSPHRIEPLYWIMNICRLNGWNQQGYMVGKIALTKLNPNPQSLFLERWIYDYGALDEFSICSYYSGNGGESKEICARLLSEGRIPDSYIPRLKNNLNICG